MLLFHIKLSRCFVFFSVIFIRYLFRRLRNLCCRLFSSSSPSYCLIPLWFFNSYCCCSVSSPRICVNHFVPISLFPRLPPILPVLAFPLSFRILLTNLPSIDTTRERLSTVPGPGGRQSGRRDSVRSDPCTWATHCTERRQPVYAWRCDRPSAVVSPAQVVQAGFVSASLTRLCSDCPQGPPPLPARRPDGRHRQPTAAV